MYLMFSGSVTMGIRNMPWEDWIEVHLFTILVGIHTDPCAARQSIYSLLSHSLTSRQNMRRRCRTCSPGATGNRTWRMRCWYGLCCQLIGPPMINKQPQCARVPSTRACTGACGIPLRSISLHIPYRTDDQVRDQEEVPGERMGRPVAYQVNYLCPA